jgi:hypothetical protein
MTGYTVPVMYTIGPTVELIRGAFWHGPKDWEGSWYSYN